MKRLSFLAMAFLAVLTASAQMIAYSVQTNVVGEPGEPTVIDLQGYTGSDLKGMMIDADGNMKFNAVEGAKGFPIGFDFRYNGQKMTHFLIGTDMVVQLSPTETISTEVHMKRIPCFTTDGIHDIIGMIPREGVWGLDDTKISYWLEGKEGYRALVIEYKNIDFGNGGGWGTEGEFCGAKATVQFRLYEQNGNIEMKVKGMKPADPGRSNFFRIGILGDSNDFVQIQSWDGSVISARDNSISYNQDKYPVDGQVYTFVAPEPCVSPTVSGSDLQLTSITDQISGVFKPGNGDHFIVLATTDDELSEKPVDKMKYKVGDVIGNAKVIAITDSNEFTGITGMEQGTYNVFVFAFNSACMDGPLYSSDAFSATIALKPAKPAALALVDADKNSMKLKATDCGAQMVIAITEERGQDRWGDPLSTGQFGEPTGNYNVGDAIEGGGKVVYVGNTSNAINVSELVAGKVYFFRAWSTDGNGGYSSEWLDINAMTATELPWEPALEGTGPSEVPLGWTSNSTEDNFWTVENYNDLYLYSDARYVEGTLETWAESPAIYLNEGSNWLSVEIGANSVPVRWASDWEMADGEEVAIQLTTDGVKYKNILTITKDEMPTWTMDEFKTFRVNFSEYAGQKVNIRLYVKRATKGQVNFRNLKVEGTLYGIVGTIPGLTWDNDIFMSQDPDNKNVYTASLNVEVTEVPEEAYSYKLRTNQNWDGYQLPAEGNQYWMPAEAGTYTLVFTADIAANNLSLSVQRPFSVSFDNKGNWGQVYAYTFTYDPLTDTTTEYSGAWPGTPVEVSGGFFNRSWTYNFTADQQPQYIIWNNGGGDEWEQADQTDDLPFVNGKKYSYFPEITSIQLPGTFNNWNGSEMTPGDYANQWNTTIAVTEDVEFKLLVNGNWLGYNDVTIEDPNGWLEEGAENGNIKLKHSVAQKDAYFIVAYWKNPGTDVKSGWLIAVEEGDPTTVGINGVRANAAQKTIHNLKGQRLQKKQRGVNIVNGKKVTVK